MEIAQARLQAQQKEAEQQQAMQAADMASKFDSSVQQGVVDAANTGL